VLEVVNRNRGQVVLEDHGAEQIDLAGEKEGMVASSLAAELPATASPQS
jgi:hypothetical protein